MIGRLLVTFVALVTALAAGIALGGGPLSDIGDTPSQAAPVPEKPEVDPLAEARAAYADAFAGSVATSLYAGGLHDQPVALLTLPGADEDVVAALGAEVSAAGSEVTGIYRLRRGLVDAGEKSLVDTLGRQLVETLGSEVVTPDASTYDCIGQLIGQAVAARKPSKALDPAKAASLRASLHGAGLLAVPDGEPGVASMVLVVTGSDVDPLVLDGIVAGLAAVARGVVVAGPTGDVGVAGLRSEAPARPVATVDGTDTPAGRVATVLTLIHVASTPGGSYGASGSDGPAPLG